MQNSVRWDADSAMDSFNKKYYRDSSHFINGYNFKKDGHGHLIVVEDNNAAGFWTQAEMIEMVEDAFLRSNNPIYSKMIDELYLGFIKYQNQGSNWLMNLYNDDIMWMILACTRAHMMKQDKYGYSIYKGPAIAYFDAVYNMAYDDKLGGGLYWTRDPNAKNPITKEPMCRLTKNACINCPAIITAIQLYNITGCTKYLEKAQNLYSWVKTNLFDKESGQVYDHKRVDKERGEESVIRWTFTYNQGTFIGAAHALYKAQKISDDRIIEDAKKALRYTKEKLCESKNGILIREYSNDEEIVGDSPGFKGIFARWAAKFIWDKSIEKKFNERELKEYKSWMQENALSAWKNKNFDNIMFTDFNMQCPDKIISWAASSGVVFLQVVPIPDA